MSVAIKGSNQLMKKLQNLERKGAKSAVRKSARAGGAVLLRGVRQAAPVEEGLLKKMFVQKVSNLRLSATAIVGADVAKLQAAASTEGREERPSNVDHLVEYGHVASDGRFVPPTGFMAYAAEVTIPAAEAAYIARLTSEIEKEASK